MAVSPHKEHECSAYCRGNRHADVFWTPIEDERIEATSRTFLGRYGLRLLRWEHAPEAQWPEGVPAIRYHHEDGYAGIYQHDPTEHPVLLVWEAAPAPAGVAG